MPFFGDFENYEYENAKAVILPVLLKEKYAYLKSRYHAALSILEHSRNITHNDAELGEIYKFAKFNIAKPMRKRKKETAKEFIERVSKKIYQAYADKKFPIVLGESHLTSLASAIATKKFHKDFTLLHFDAHPDLFNKLYGHYSCATVMRRISELGINIVSVGIRTFELEEKKFAEENNIAWIFANDIIGSTKKSIKKILKQIKTEKVFFSIDVDVFDPSIMHSAFPEPNGINFSQFFDIIKEVCRKKRVVGFDIVEHLPLSKDDYTSYFVSWLLYRISGFCLKL